MKIKDYSATQKDAFSYNFLQELFSFHIFGFVIIENYEEVNTPYRIHLSFYRT